jgi:hypothetical protein
MGLVTGEPVEPKRSGPRHLYDEALEIVLDIRMRAEGGQRKNRLFLGSLSKILDQL